jgi:hypothetical protein
MSGMRKPSPISISSPRLTIASPPEASSLSASRTAAVIHHNTGLTREPFNQRRCMRIALAAAAFGKIVFEIRIAVGARSAAQVRMKYHARRVDYALQRRLAQTFDIAPDLFLDPGWNRQILASIRDHAAGFLDQ